MYANDTSTNSHEPGIISLGLLMAATVLVLVTHPPHIPEFSTGAFAGGNATTTEHVMEWRPQGPPPWGDADQLSPDEVTEESSVVAGGERGREDMGSSRSRPEL